MDRQNVITLNSKDDATAEIRERIRKQNLDVLVLNYPLSTDGDMITDSPLAMIKDTEKFRFRIILGENCTSADKMFFGCTELKYAPELNLESVRSMNWMFDDCLNLTDVPNYCAPKAKSAKGMFRHCKSLTDIPRLDVPETLALEGFTQGCSSLTTVPELKSPIIVLDSADDVTDVVRLRTASSDLEEIIINFDVERKLLFGQFTQSNSPFSGLPTLEKIRFKITIGPACRSLEGLFYGCANLKEAPEMNTSNVKNMNTMFQDCALLVTVPAYDTSNCTSMKNMFHGCNSLEHLPCFDTSKVENMFGMFEGCSKLKSIPSMNTEKVRDFSWFLCGCSSLETIPKLNTSSSESMCGMFNRCQKLGRIPCLSLRKLKEPDKLFSGYSNQNAIDRFWGIFRWRLRLNRIVNWFKKIRVQHK